MAKSQPALAIDMVVQMPKSLFQEKDYQNMRYFYRRAYYIAYIAAHVRVELGDSADLVFELLHDNPLLPLLTIRPRPPHAESDANPKKNTAHGTEYSIRLIPCAPDELFAWSKLTPASNCNRAKTHEDKASATPFYNSTINAETTFISYLRVLTHARNECPAFPDVCILGRIWLQQRGFGGAISQGGFGTFEWAIMIALLLSADGQMSLSTSLSSTELFKAAIQFLATTDFTKKAFIFATSTADNMAFRESGPVLFDSKRQLNIAFKMTPWSASLLRLYAKSTADLLADETTDKFNATFIMKANSDAQVFDATFDIETSCVSSRFCETADRGSPVCKFSAEAYRVLRRAYGERAKLVHLSQKPRVSWPLNAATPNQASKVLVGVIFHPTNMSRRLEKGPPVDDQKEAATFRKFWGEKAEMRRFKDGSTLECVEWESTLAHPISEEIARFALQRHMAVMKDELTARGSDFSSIINQSHLDKEAFDAARRAFSTLENDIRDLEDVPLQIRQLSPISPMFRYSSVKPPTLALHKESVEPMDASLYFEASAKWPENLTAIQEAKIEFLLDLDKRLAAAHDNLTTYLGRENRDVGIENLAYLDIVYGTGAAFRILILCDLEETLLERRAKNRELDPRERDESVECLAKFRWLYTILPLHSQTVATFCTRLPALSPSLRLVKHWFDCHKLSGHFSAELVELFVLHVFLKPYPWSVPSSPATGFLRTLHFLSRWDWRDEALVVDSAETLTSEHRFSMRKELESWRRRDPQINRSALFVATSHDQSGMAYTRNGPCKLLASRMTRLAKAACKLVREQPDALDSRALFQTSLQDYDVLIHLSAKAVRGVAREAAAVAGARKPVRFKNLDGRTGQALLPARASPVDVLAGELQRVYEDTLVLFRGGAHEAVLAAIWSPRLQPQGSRGVKFRVGLPYNFCRQVGSDCDGDDDRVQINRDAVLLEIARAGGDLIKRIEVVDEEEPGA